MSKTVLITGASSGIGRSLALALAGRGERLVLGGRDPARLETVSAACAPMAGHCETAQIDVRDRAAMEDWVREADRRLGLDLVIANAGISAGTGGGPEGESTAQAEQIFEVNLTGLLNTIHPVLPLMRARGRGQIALMSSLAGFSGWPGAPAYSASKAAVRCYGEALRGWLAPEGIRVSTICPGFVSTAMADGNRFPMPFMMDADRAAALILKGLDANRTRIAFPWPTYVLAGLAGLMPGWMGPRVLGRLPRKPAMSPDPGQR